jgi:membrane-bound metal-dependent hydrolase YbcI (DUF457 family)
MTFGMASFALMAGPVAHLSGMPEVPIWGLPVGLAVGSVAGLLPDIDEPNAMLARGSWVPRRLGPLARFIGMIVSLPFKIAGFFIKGALGHRGGTHSLAMSAIFSLIFAMPITMLGGPEMDWLIWTIWFGFISHLVADMLNPSGVPLFWPMRSKHKTNHLLPKPLRIPTQTPPNRREGFTRFMASGFTFVSLGFFYALLPLWNM